MPDNVLVFYGSYRTMRIGIRMARFVTNELRACGAVPELIDAREIGLPIIDRMYKEYPKGSAPPAMEKSCRKNPRGGCLRVRRWRIQLGTTTGLEEPHGSLFGGMVLAARRHLSATRQAGCQVPGPARRGIPFCRRWAWLSCRAR